jgi:hypothetical protein
MILARTLVGLENFLWVQPILYKAWNNGLNAVLTPLSL